MRIVLIVFFLNLHFIVFGQQRGKELGIILDPEKLCKLRMVKEFRIKKIEGFLSERHDSTLNQTPIKSSEEMFDSKGRPLSSKSFNVNGEYNKAFTYYPDGRIATEKTWAIHEGKTLYVYNDTLTYQELDDCVIITSSFNKNIKKEYYRSNYKKIKIEYFSLNDFKRNQPYQTDNWTYDSLDRVIEIESIESNNKAKVFIKYDNSNNITSLRYIWSSDKEIQAEYLYSYFDNGLISTKGTAKGVFERFKYDRGVLTEKVRPDEDFEVVEMFKYEYE